MDSLDSFLDDYLITKARVLREIDEETAYIYYLSEAYQLPEFDLELRKAYHSPIRTTKVDEKPSFSVFENTRENDKYDYRVHYLWKDSGTSQGGTSGDIFTLVKLLYGLSSEEEVLRKIDFDFGLNLFSDLCNSSLDRKPIKVTGKIIPKAPSFIKIKSKPFTLDGLAFWKKYGITKDILEKYHVTQVEYFWTQENQQVPYSPKSLCFAYRIGKYYKLYTPNVTEYKFINDYPEDYVEGWEQIDITQDYCIITKSLKDVMVLNSLGYTAVSPKSESTMIKRGYIDLVIHTFDKVFILFDNDGKHNYEKYKELYPQLPLIQVPLESGTKDISDYRVKFGEEETKYLLKKLIK